MAQYHVVFEQSDNRGQYGLYVHSADAKSMKRRDLNAATEKAHAKAKRVAETKGIKIASTIEVRCVG